MRCRPGLFRVLLGPFSIVFVIPRYRREMFTRRVEVMFDRFQMSLPRRFDGTVSLYRRSHLPDNLVHPPFVRQINAPPGEPTAQRRNIFLLDLIDNNNASPDLLSAFFDKVRASRERSSASM